MYVCVYILIIAHTYVRCTDINTICMQLIFVNASGCVNKSKWQAAGRARLTVNVVSSVPLAPFVVQNLRVKQSTKFHCV